MKPLYVAAGALLLLGTSAPAWHGERSRSAAQDYPPCAPGPGDDSCIQLYERGVRAQPALGGPYEPLAGHVDASPTGAITSEAAMNADIGSGSAAPDDEPDIQIDHDGVGGPVVSQSGYPPCEPGPGDDRCIQLYERGVTGAGN